jgi:hypothetical protein
MIRVTPGIEDGVRDAQFLYGIRLMAAGDYRQYLLGLRNTPPAETTLLGIGTEEAQREYRRALLSDPTNPGKLNDDGSLKLGETKVSFARSFGESGEPNAFDIAARVDRNRLNPKNERLRVYVDGKYLLDVEHNSTGNWASVVRHVERETTGPGTYVVRETDTGPVLAEWVREGGDKKDQPPAFLRYDVFKNGTWSALLQTDETVPAKVLARAFELTHPSRGDAIKVSRNGSLVVEDEGVGGVHGFHVSSARLGYGILFAAKGESINDAIHATFGNRLEDGDTVAYAPFRTGKWDSLTFHPPKLAEKPSPDQQVWYRGNVNYCLGSEKRFLASNSDQKDVIAKAEEALKAGPGDRIMIKAETRGIKAAFGAGYWTRAN